MEDRPARAGDPMSETQGLPTNVDAERFVLGSIMLDDVLFPGVRAALETNDFSLEKHRRIYRRMVGLDDRGEKIDRITVHNELILQEKAARRLIIFACANLESRAQLCS